MNKSKKKFNQVIVHNSEKEAKLTFTIIKKSMGNGPSEPRYVCGIDPISYKINEMGQWDRSLITKASLNQSSLPSEFPSINNMFKETILKTESLVDKMKSAQLEWQQNYNKCNSEINDEQTS